MDKIDPYYDCLYILLSEYAEAFCHGAEMAFDRNGACYNANILRFEVFAYFAFLLDREFWRRNHDPNVILEMNDFCSIQLESIFPQKEEFKNVDIARLFQNRHNRYMLSYSDECNPIERAEDELSLVNLLFENVSKDKIVFFSETSCSFDGAVVQAPIFRSLFNLHLLIAMQFLFCLKHILLATDNIHSLNIMQIGQLARKGVEEAKKLKPAFKSMFL